MLIIIWLKCFRTTSNWIEKDVGYLNFQITLSGDVMQSVSMLTLLARQLSNRFDIVGKIWLTTHVILNFLKRQVYCCMGFV